MIESQFQLVKAINERKQISEEAIADLLNLIQAPPTLPAFFHLIPLLPEVFEAASKIAVKSDMDAGRYRKALATANLLASVISELEDDVRLRHYRAHLLTHRFGPCKGFLGTHPLYSALSDTIPHKNFHGRFVQLNAQILLAMESLGTIKQELLDVLKAPFSRFRALSSQKNWGLLKDLPAIPVPATTFAEIVKTTFRKTDFQPICKIFEVAKNPLSRKKRVKKKQPVRKSTLPKPMSEEDEEPAAEYLKDLQPSTVLTQQESEEYINHGGLPQELGSDIDLEPVLAPDQYHGPGRRQLAFQAKQASNRRAMLNQFCALGWNKANLFDLKLLFDYFEGKNQLDGFDFHPLTREDTIVILGLMFFTSNSLERVLSFPVFPGFEPHLDSVEGVFHTEGHLIQVRLHSPGPELKKRIKLSGAFPVTHYSTVPLPPFFTQCLEKIGNPLSTGQARVFLIDSVNPADESSVENIISALRRVMGELNSKSGARLSLGRISTYMLFRLAEAARCDLPGAMLFFGRNDKIARTRIHYTLADSEHLEMTYRNCTNNLLDRVGCTGGFIPGESTKSSGYLGTPLCPKEDTVRKLVGDLQAKLSEKTLSLVDRHNFYALYTSMMISFGTGFRAIHDPSFREMEIDTHWELGVISDKGNSVYRTRYVYLAPVILKQIKYYREHVQAIYARLGVVNPSLFNLVKTYDCEGLPLNFYWLSGDMEPLELLKPGVTKEILAKKFDYTIPVNAGRHFIKYNLIKAGCSPELVEAQLGHWEVGQEPWGAFSNLDPLDFVSQMACFIPDIMENSGWRALDSYGND